MPTIAVTGDDDPGMEQRLGGEGVAAFFRKPLLDPDGLLAAAVELPRSAAAGTPAVPTREG